MSRSKVAGLTPMASAASMRFSASFGGALFGFAVVITPRRCHDMKRMNTDSEPRKVSELFQFLGSTGFAEVQADALAHFLRALQVASPVRPKHFHQHLMQLSDRLKSLNGPP